jgi:hypothetical protein
VILQWTPNRESYFYTFEVLLMDGDRSGRRLTPNPLRAALWIDPAPLPGPRTYGVRAVSASGVASPITTSREFHVRD